MKLQRSILQNKWIGTIYISFYNEQWKQKSIIIILSMIGGDAIPTYAIVIKYFNA